MAAVRMGSLEHSGETVHDSFGECAAHHGSYSANPPYTVLDVIGTAITARLNKVGRHVGLDFYDLLIEGDSTF